MGRPIDNLTGRRFGRLVVLEYFYDTWITPDNNKKQVLKWRCQCDCGGIATPTRSKLLNGSTTGCHQCKYERVCAANRDRSRTLKGHFEKKRQLAKTEEGGLTRTAPYGTLHALVHLNQLFANKPPVTNPDSQDQENV